MKNQLNNRKMYAITGANGFIGKHLTSYLKNKDISVKRISRDNKDSDFVINELSKSTNWKSAFEGVEVIFHLAAKVHETKSPSDMNDYLKVNYEATENLISAACDAGVKKIIFLSTIKVNGENTKIGYPFNLKSKPNPKDPYSISKFKAEELFIKYGLENNLEFTIIRIPIVYGPGVKANFFRLLNLVHSKLPLPFGSINNKRSYLYVENLTDFLFECSINENAIGKTFLLSDPIPLSTKELIKAISNAFNQKPFLISINIRLLKAISFILIKSQVINKLTDSLELDPKYSYKTLNWFPPFTLDIALNKTVNWFLKNKKIRRF